MSLNTTRSWLVGALVLVVCGCSRPSDSNVAQSSRLASPQLPETTTGVPSQTPNPTETATATETPTCTPTLAPTQTPVPTRTLGPAPEVIASYPIDGDRAMLSDRALVLRFSRPMDRDSVAASLALSPTVSGQLDWPDDATCRFTPDSAWQPGLDWALNLGTGASAHDGAHLAEGFAISFKVGGPGAPIPILMYHHIVELDDGASNGQRTWTVSPDALAEQVDYLASQGYHSITPTQMAQYLAYGQPLEPRPVMLTFDDGYKELHDIVMPLFAETDLRPVLFIVPEYLGYGAYLNWDQLADLVAKGCLVGAHGYDHSNLRDATDDGLAHQIVDSQRVLGERLGITVDAFCYPYGSYDDRVLEMLAASSYATGYTLNPSVYQDPGFPLQLSRLLIHYEMTLDEFAERLR